MGMRPCRFRVGNRDQEILGEERMELKPDDGKRRELGMLGGDFSGLQERMESDG